MFYPDCCAIRKQYVGISGAVVSVQRQPGVLKPVVYIIYVVIYVRIYIVFHPCGRCLHPPSIMTDIFSYLKLDGVEEFNSRYYLHSAGCITITVSIWREVYGKIVFK